VLLTGYPNAIPVPSLFTALAEMGLPASVEHVIDIKEIANYGFVGTPALVINGKVVASGTVPTAKKVTEWLTRTVASDA
jgi:hypothetical protein